MTAMTFDSRWLETPAHVTERAGRAAGRLPRGRRGVRA